MHKILFFFYCIFWLDQWSRSHGYTNSLDTHRWIVLGSGIRGEMDAGLKSKGKCVEINWLVVMVKIMSTEKQAQTRRNTHTSAHVLPNMREVCMHQTIPRAIRATESRTLHISARPPLNSHCWLCLLFWYRPSRLIIWYKHPKDASFSSMHQLSISTMPGYRVLSDMQFCVMFHD